MIRHLVPFLLLITISDISMRKILVLCILSIEWLFCFSQPAPLGDSGTYLLHKFAQHIGKESFHAKKDGDAFIYSIDFRFTDRGTPVPLRTTLVINSAMQPRSLVLRGRTSRMSGIQDSVVINGRQAFITVNDSSYTKQLKANSFPVGGYSPGLVQLALLQYWKNQGRPAVINLLPTGSVRITKDGTDTVSPNGERMIWDRYVISGLIWGNELVWVDMQGRLACLITNDAEGDKLEMMQENYEPLLSEMIGRAAKYGMRLFVASLGKQFADPKRTRVITGATIPDLETGKLKKDMTVIIENGIIRSIEEGAAAKIPAGAEIIRANGKHLLPGLWDMHAHFQQAEWGPAYLAAGVTTVRDCGNEFDYINSIKQVIDAGQGVGPAIIKAGIIDGPGPIALGVIRANDAREAAKAVKLYKDNGFEQIKIYSSVTPSVVKAICDEAHRVGLTVTGHIPQRMTLFQGIDSGMDMINHISYIRAAMKLNKDQSINWNDSSELALQQLAAKKVVIDPTLSVYELMFRSTAEDPIKIEPGFYTLPEPLQVLFKNLGLDSARARAVKPVFEGLQQLIGKMKDHKIIFVAGTDMGFPGFSLARELEIYVASGLSPLEAIRTATIIPAGVMKKDQQYGTVMVGKKADLILVDGDPLSNIQDIRKIAVVFRNGVPYDPAVLHKLAGFSK
jgi:imidazolonepropionase-like amidohydrolase